MYRLTACCKASEWHISTYGENFVLVFLSVKFHSIQFCIAQIEKSPCTGWDCGRDQKMYLYSLIQLPLLALPELQCSPPVPQSCDCSICEQTPLRTVIGYTVRRAMNVTSLLGILDGTVALEQTWLQMGIQAIFFLIYQSSGLYRGM